MIKSRSVQKYLMILAVALILVSNVATMPTAVQAQTYPVLQLVAPTGAITTNQPTFVWVASTHPGATAYDLRMLWPNGDITQDRYTLAQMKTEGRNLLLNTGKTYPPGEYLWKVRYRLWGETYSEYSQPMAFTVPANSANVPTQPPQATASSAAPASTQAAATATTAPPNPQAPVNGAYYVAPNGNDGNPGSESAPWRSIQTAVNRLSAGQSLYVRAGTYNETVNITVSGASGNPIKIMAYPGETPVIDGNNYQLPSSDWAAMLKLSGNYIQMSGFEVRNTNWMAVVLSGSNNVVSGFNVHHNMENGILITGNNDIVENSSVWMNCLSNQNGSRTRGGWSSGLSAARYPNNAIIRNNKVYQNWGEGLSTYEANGTIIEGNVVYDNYATNTYISDSTNVLMQRNIIYATAGSPVNSGARTGIMMGDERYAPASSNIRILNNIVFGAYQNFYWWQGSQGGGMNNVLIANNTFVNTRTGDNFRINGGTHQSVRIMNNVIMQEDSLSIANINGSGITLSNNIWSKAPGSAAMGGNSIVADPMLAKTGSQTSCDWFHLTSSSPAIDRGVNLSEVVEDHDRASRSGTSDMGADEFPGQASVPNPTAVPPTTTAPVSPTATSVAPTSVAPTSVAPTTVPANPDPSNPGTAGQENLALNKPASQSSDLGTDPLLGKANLAVDGKTNGVYNAGSTTHTLNQAQPWWQVDLGSVQPISKISIWNRTDCCGDRLSNFNVMVSDTPFASTGLEAARSQAGVGAYAVTGQGGMPTIIDINRTGRYIRVQLSGTNPLSLAEVQVWKGGSSVPQPTTVPPTATSVPPTVTSIAPTATSIPPTAVPTQPAATNGTYYVAPNGNDSNTGTQNAPWRTIQAAVNRLSAGQTLYVRAGSYNETVNITVSGTASSPIKIMAYPGETPVIDGNNYQLPTAQWGVMLKLSGNYIQMSGFEVRYTNWMAVVLSGSNNVVSGFNVHHNKENGILITGNNDIVEKSFVWMNCLSNENGIQTRQGWSSGLSAARYPNNAIIRNNVVYNNWGEGLSTYEANGTIIEGNVVHDNWAANIYISDATNVLVQRNLVYAVGDSIVKSGGRVGIMMGDERYSPASSNVRIINNLVYGTNKNFYWWQGTQGGGMNSVLIANNTFVNSRSGENFRINVGTHQNSRVMNNLFVQEDTQPIALFSGSGVTFSNNMWSKTPPATCLGSSSITGDPRLAKSGSPDIPAWYQLTSSSPAINKGRTLTEVSEDYYREARTGTYDIGADEFNGQAVPTTAPSQPGPTSTSIAPTTQPTTAPTKAATQAPAQSGPVSGAYYVATNGSDSNPGTQSAPWRTIQYGANRLPAGQTLYVRAGLYRETITISRSGTASSPIKIMAYPGETPVIDGNNYQLPSSTWAAMLKLSGNYIQMSGFEVRYTNWMAVVLSGSNNVVSGFNVHHNKENGILITGNSDIVENSSVWMNCLSNENGIQTRQGWASGLSAARYPNNAIIRNNVVYNNWGEGLSTYEANGTIIEGNIVYDNYATNVYISDATNVLVQRNIIYATAGSSVNKGARSGIMMGDERYAPASSNIRILNNIVFGTYRNLYWWQGSQGGGMNNVLIANNTFVNSRSTTNFQISNGTHQNVRIMNNIFSQEDSLSIALIYGSGITLSNNLWSKTPGAAALGSSSIVGDPRFAKTGSQTSMDWYKLLSGSSATDKGRALTEVTEDFTRYRRTGTLDIGAYEYR